MFTHEEIKMLAKQEHEMDIGTQPFVVTDGTRLATQESEMEYFGFQQGQTISQAILTALKEHRIDSMKRERMEST